ncbi:MAG: YDG domain-containing protein [Betaproteobacteria bacterium]
MKYPQGRSSTRPLAADRSRSARPPLRLGRLAHALAAGSLLTLWPGATTLQAQTLPSGMSTVAGQASARTVGNTLTITNSPGTILNWNSFSIGAQNAVRFEQSSASSQVLNRVTGTDPSSILGGLSSNGRVWLLNPNGVLFGQGARIDVASLVTSTLNLNDTDWLAGRYRFTQGSGPAADVVNQGDLRSSFGGHVALIGGTVRNEGDITAPGGQIVLAAGSDVELLDTATPNVGVKVNAGEGNVLNLGQLLAAGGRIDIHAATVNQDGIMRADALERGPGGEVVLRARDQLNLGAASQTTANGGSGGRITLEADQTMVRGTVSATGSQDAGGQIQLLGRQVGLLDAARVDVSGAGGGGEVLVGGGEQGKDPNVPNAQAVYFGPQAGITADATASGDGGRIILWSDEATRAFGSLSARGGPLGGDGGFIETSGGWLDARPVRVDISAPYGHNGSWLLDPYDVTVTDDPAAINQGTDASFTANADSAVITWSTISSALAAGTQVTVSTSATGSEGTQAGDIAINILGSPPVNAGTGASLTFIADRSISVNGTLTFQGASMPLTFLAGRSGSGAIQLPNTTITLQNGDITFGGFTNYNRAGGGTFQGATGYDASHPTGVDFSTADLTALAGTITANGGSRYQGTGSGVSLSNSNLLARNIVINGNTADFGTTGPGIGTSLATLEADQTMDLRGMGTTQGIAIGLESQLILTNSFSPASLRLFGAGQQNEGVLLDGSQTTFSLVFDKTGGSVDIDGTTAASGTAAVNIVGPGYTTNVIDVSGGTTLTIGGVATSTQLSNAFVSANPADVNGVPFTLYGGQTLSLTNSQITSGGPITVHADALVLGSGTSITSNFAGTTALVLQGAGTGAIQAFDNQVGSAVLSTPNSRWLLFATDPVTFNTGGLAFDFKRYNALPGDTAIASDVGNGLAFSTPEFATITGSVQTKTYDATTTATVTNVAATGVNQDQAVGLSFSGADFASPNAGTNNDVTLNGLSLQFVDANQKPVYGYLPQYLLRGSIAQAPVTVAVTGLDKVYDATTLAHPVATVTSGLVGSETLGVTSVAAFPVKDVGTYDLSVAIGLTNGSNGGLASNYSVAPTLTAPGTITPAFLSVSGLSANNRIYDTTTLATLSGIASVTPLGSDSVAVAGRPSASFADKNVGTAKSVTVSGFTLSGTDAGNYSVLQPSGLSADITPASLAVSGLVANNKVYDATVAATLSGTASVTPLGNDSVSVSGTPVGTFSDKNVGTAKSVSISALSLTGADAGNYLPVASGLSADITPASLAVSGLSANNKVYDATSLATLSGTASVKPLGSDSVAVSGSPTASFSDPNVGTGKTVAITGLGLTGPDAANYVLPASFTTTANIDPATLYYLATPVTWPAGTPLPALTGTVYGFVGGETLQGATTGAPSFTTTATAQSLPGAYPILGGGLGATNYVFAQDPANATALNYSGISPAQDSVAVSTGAPLLARQAVAPPLAVADPTQAGLVNLMPVASPPSSTTPPSTGAGAFAPVRLSDLSPSALQGMLDSRANYKKAIFSDSIHELEQDPTLADLPACQSPQDLTSGTCLITADMKREMQAARPGKTLAAPSLTAPGGAKPTEKPPAATAAAPTPAPAPAPAPAAVASTAAAARPAAAELPAALLHLPTPRVKVANLPQIVRKVALVIGVNRYTDAEIPQLSNAVGDAQAIGRIFESQLGYESIVLENPSKQTVVAALNQLALALDPQDSVVVYYAGHGQLIDSTGLGYWLLSDSDAKRPQTWLSNTDIGRLTKLFDASQVALISDSCYSGSLVGQRIRATPGTIDPQQVLSRRSVVVMSSGGNEPVADEGKDGHSPFAWNLMNNLRQLSKWQPGGNVFERVRFAVARALPQRPQYGAFGAAGDQGGGDYLFEQRQLESPPQ